MPLVRQKLVLRCDIVANRDVLYAFGDTALRVGLGGQAKEMRGEPNAIGVRTKHRPNMHPDAFFRAEAVLQVRQWWAEDLAHVAPRKGGVVVLPLDGLGTALARLPVPLLELLEHQLRRCFRVEP